MASVPVYCLCRLPYDVTRFMIECDACQDWFHGRSGPGAVMGVGKEVGAIMGVRSCPRTVLQ